MSRSVLTFALTILISLAAGCVSHRPIVGRDISKERAAAIVPGVTTEREVVDSFGPPDAVLHHPDETREYRYTYTGWRDRKVGLLFLSRTRTDKEYKNLFIGLHAGIVSRVSYQDAFDPRNSFSR